MSTFPELVLERLQARQREAESGEENKRHMFKAIVEGNVGTKPEPLKGGKYMKFSVAHREKEDTLWIDVLCKNEQFGELCAKLDKGARVLVTGRQSVNRIEGEKNKFWGPSIWAEGVEVILWPKRNEGGAAPTDAAPPGADLPF